jgi:hypothetical protein
MTKLLYIILTTVLLISSCTKSNIKHVLDEKKHEVRIITERKTQYDVYEWNYKGHIYLIIDGNNGSGITHTGHCTCQNKD